MNNNSKQLGEGSIGKLLLKFSIPAIIGMIVNALYNVVDRIFIGRGVGTIGITGITIGFPIMIILMAFGMLIGMGATSLISIRLGEHKEKEAETILGNAFIMLVGTAIIITVLGLIFLQPILLLFGASPEALPYAQQYLTIILGGAVFQFIGFGMNNFMRAEGNPKMAMIIMVVGAIANIILDPIFIFVFGLGIQGAAYATILSQAIASALVLHYYLSGKSILKLTLGSFKLHLPIVGKILAIGSAPFAMQIASSGISILYNRSLYHYSGDVAISAFGIINSISMFLLMPLLGLTQGSQPIIGYNYGAKAYDRVIKTLKLSIIAATAIVVFGFIVAEVFPSTIFSIFNKDDLELQRIGVQGIRIFLSMIPFVGFQVVSSSYFQAVGKPKHAMILSLSRQVIFLVPALIIFPRLYGLEGIWLAAPISDIAATILSSIFFYVELKHLKKDETVDSIAI